jgi:hypothetical protein
VKSPAFSSTFCWTFFLAFLLGLFLRVLLASPQRACLNSQDDHPIQKSDPTSQIGAPTMKRSRRIVLTLMGTAAVSAVSMGFVRRGHSSGPGRLSRGPCGPDGQLAGNCRITHGGFGTVPGRFHFHGGGG